MKEENLKKEFNEMKTKFDELFESTIAQRIAIAEEIEDKDPDKDGDDDSTVVGDIDAEVDKDENSEVDKDAEEDITIDEKDVASKEDLKGFAMAMAHDAFADKVDEKKVDAIVDNAVKKSDGDWGTAVGIVKNSFKK